MLILSVGLFVSVGQATTIVYYDFEPGNIDLTGNSVTDGSLNGYDGKFKTAGWVDSTAGLSVFATGEGIGQALHVDGATGDLRLLIGNSPAFVVPTMANGTFQFFIRPDVDGMWTNGLQMLFQHGFAPGDGSITASKVNRPWGGYGRATDYSLGTNNGAQTGSVVTDPDIFFTGTDPDYVGTGWKHLAVTWGTAGLKLYLEQTLVDSDPTYTGSLYNSAGDWFHAFYTNECIFD
ncbi:unnamed protein product, partial [marine sediment metagenome]